MELSFSRRGVPSQSPTLSVPASAQQQAGETSEQLNESQRLLKNELARNRYAHRGVPSQSPTLPVPASAQQQEGETSEQLNERQRLLINELARNRYVPRSDRGVLRPGYVSPARLHVPDEDTEADEDTRADSAESHRLRRNETERLRHAERRAAFEDAFCP